MLFSCLETIVQNKGITTNEVVMIQKGEGSHCQWLPSLSLNSAAEKIPGQVCKYLHVRSDIDSPDVNNS